jgi:hypothetical protein
MSYPGRRGGGLPGAPPLEWPRRVAVACLVLIAAATPWARADESIQAAQTARAQRDRQRQADLKAAGAAGAVGQDGWTLSAELPHAFTSIA